MSDNNSLDQVQCFLLDMDGTFYLGERLIEGALHFIDVLHQQGRDFLFLTNNSSKDSQQYAEKINRLGLAIPREKVMTSGEATAMHIHHAPKGSAGAVMVSLPVPNEEGEVDECVSVDPQLLEKIKNNPQDYYINIHTETYPDGAIRGQLS